MKDNITNKNDKINSFEELFIKGQTYKNISEKKNIWKEMMDFIELNFWFIDKLIWKFLYSN